MTSRERILAVLRGQSPDRIPLCSWTYFESIPEYRKGADWMSVEALKVSLDFYEKIGADYWQWNAFPYYTDVYCMLELRTKPGANIEVKKTHTGKTVRTEYEIPVGSIFSVDTYSEIGHTTYHEKGLLETVSDLKIFQYIIENIGYEPDHENLSRHLDVLGQNGVMCIASPPPPLKSLLLGAMRLNNAIFMIYDHKEEFDQLVRMADEKNCEIYQMLAASPATVFVDAAVSGLGMISPEIFAEYYLPYTKKYADILHRDNKLYINHTSGEQIGAILDMIKESSIDGLYGLTYPPVVDTKIFEVRDKCQGQIAAMGGKLCDFIATQTIEEIQDRARDVLEDVASGGHFMMVTVDDTPYGAPPAKLKAVSEVVRQSQFS